jgi:dephospho-CoA kinase
MSGGQACPVVVLTGGIGSGKSTAAHCFEGLGITVVDADAIVHELTGPDGSALASLRLLLGEDFMSPAAGLDRAKVRQAVFADPSLRKGLEAILHPMVQVVARQRLGQALGPYCLYVVPLWTETHGSQPRPDWVWRVVVVDIDQARQRSRVLKRTPMPNETLEGMLAAQAHRDERLALADHVISNNSDEASLLAQVQRLHAELLQCLNERPTTSHPQSKPLTDRP